MSKEPGFDKVGKASHAYMTKITTGAKTNLPWNKISPSTTQVAEDTTGLRRLMR